jgi:hypothetical protein
MVRVESIPLFINRLSLDGNALSHDAYLIAIAANITELPTMNGMQKFAKKVILKISQFTFNKHNNTSCVDSARAHQATLAA